MNKTSYLNLVTYRNSMKEKYMAFVDLILDQPLGSAAVTDSILYAFDLDNACGVNLDIIGAIVGMDRLLPFAPTLGTREMNDDEYRLMIRMKIARNTWDGRNETVLPIYRELFPQMNFAYEDNQDCTVTFTVTGNFDYREIEIIMRTDCMLVPAGVGYNVEQIDNGTTFRLYAAVTPHGELVIDRVEASEYAPITSLSWAQLSNMSWGSVSENNWGDLANTGGDG